jgi:hypothetical protein
MRPSDFRPTFEHCWIESPRPGFDNCPASNPISDVQLECRERPPSRPHSPIFLDEDGEFPLRYKARTSIPDRNHSREILSSGGATTATLKPNGHYDHFSVCLNVWHLTVHSSSECSTWSASKSPLQDDSKLLWSCLFCSWSAGCPRAEDVQLEAEILGSCQPDSISLERLLFDQRSIQSTGENSWHSQTPFPCRLKLNKCSARFSLQL